MLRLDTDTLSKVLKLGAKVKKLLGRDAAEAQPKAADTDITPAHLLGP
jgi:hypothetical protein